MDNWFNYLRRGFSRQRQEDRLLKKTGAANFKHLYPYIARHWPAMAFGAILILLISLSAYVQPLIQRFLIDNVILGKQLNLLIGAVLLLAGLQLAGKLGGLFQSFYFERFGQKVVLEIQSDLIGRTLRFPKTFFDEKETGYLMARLSDDVQGLRWFFSGTLFSALSNVLRFIAGAGLLFYLEWRLALGMLLILPALGLAVSYFAGTMRALSHHSMEQRAGVLRRLQETLSSIPLLKSFASEKREAKRVTAELEAASHLSLEQNAVNSFANLIISSLSDLAKLITLLAGVPLVVSGNWSAGSLFAFFSYLAYIYNPVQSLTYTVFQFQTALAALERISAFYAILPEENETGLKVERLNGSIEFKNVSFSYNGSGAVLKNLSFLVSPGEHVAIIGPSGIGKTTLISLLLGFYRPKQGEIFFDNRPAAHYALGALRRRIGYVAQSTRLLSGTILENLRYGNLEASEVEVQRAAQVAGIHDFITGLKGGYNSSLGENGVNLSEGQKQRLSIARALIKDPDVLILDEPSAALDAETEKSIFESLPEVVRHKTLIMVTHRESTSRAADRVIAL